MNSEVWLKLKPEFLVCKRGTCSLTVGDWTSLCRQKYLILRSARGSNSRNVESSQGKPCTPWTDWEVWHMMYSTAFRSVTGPRVLLGLWVWMCLPFAYQIGIYLGTHLIFFFACVRSPALRIGCFTLKPSFEVCQPSSRSNRSLSGWPADQNDMVCHSRTSSPWWQGVEATRGTTSLSFLPLCRFSQVVYRQVFYKNRSTARKSTHVDYFMLHECIQSLHMWGADYFNHETSRCCL